MPIVTTSSRKRPRRSAALPVAVAAVIALGAAAYLLLREGPASSGPRNGGAPPPQPGPAASPVPSASPVAAAPSTAPAGQREPVADASTPQPLNLSPLQPSNPSDPVASNQALPVETVISVPKRPTGFNGGAMEQLLGMMAGASNGHDLPPMPMGSEKSMLRDLMIAATNDIVVFDDDDDATVAFKERVAEFKNQLADIVENGGSVTNALAEFANWHAEGQALRREISAEYKRLLEEASREEADQYLSDANAQLRQEGIAEVTP